MQETNKDLAKLPVHRSFQLFFARKLQAANTNVLNTETTEPKRRYADATSRWDDWTNQLDSVSRSSLFPSPCIYGCVLVPSLVAAHFLFSADYSIHDCTLILPFCSVHMPSSLILRCPRILLVLGRGKNLQFDGEILLKISLFVTLGTQIEQRTNVWKYK
jgi:hypothetical protein